MGRFAFCCTFPILRRSTLARRMASDGGRYPPPRPMEPGLSSPRSTAGRPEGDDGDRATTVQPTRERLLSYQKRRTAALMRPAPLGSLEMGSDMASFTVDWRDADPDVCQGGAVAVGNFDGVHCGHASLVAELRTQAAKVGGPAVVVTFDPHPRDVLRPDLAVPPLATPRDRCTLLH